MPHKACGLVKKYETKEIIFEEFSFLARHHFGLSVNINQMFKQGWWSTQQKVKLQFIRMM